MKEIVDVFFSWFLKRAQKINDFKGFKRQFTENYWRGGNLVQYETLSIAHLPSRLLWDSFGTVYAPGVCLLVSNFVDPNPYRC